MNSVNLNILNIDNNPNPTLDGELVIPDRHGGSVIVNIEVIPYGSKYNLRLIFTHIEPVTMVVYGLLNLNNIFIFLECVYAHLKTYYMLRQIGNISRLDANKHFKSVVFSKGSLLYYKNKFTYDSELIQSNLIEMYINENYAKLMYRHFATSNILLDEISEDDYVTLPLQKFNNIFDISRTLVYYYMRRHPKLFIKHTKSDKKGYFCKTLLNIKND